MPQDLKLSYYPWLTQNVDPTEIDRQIKSFANLVGGALSEILGDTATVTVQRPVEVPEQIKGIVSGEHHVALMNPLGYVFARERSKAVTPVAVAIREIDGKDGDTYFAQVYTSRKSAVKKLYNSRKEPTEKWGEADPKSQEAFLKQIFNDDKKSRYTRSIGFGLPYSTSNFLVPAYDLRRAGVNPFTRFVRTEFLKGHEVIARAVYDGKVDLGAGHDGVIKDLANQAGYGDAEERLVTLLRSDPIPSDPVAVNIADDALRAAVQQALVAAGKSDDGKKALAIFWGNTKGLGVIDEKAYEPLNQILGALGFAEKDLL